VLLNQGVKLGEGSPKEMIDAYKQVLVGQYPLPEEEGSDSLLEVEEPEENTNPELLEYGTKEAQIEEYYITDGEGRRTGAIIKGQECSVHMKVRFMQDIQAPIFAFTIKNIKGVEITGTNTMVEKAFLSPVQAGCVKNIVFTQKLDLQGGEYLLSLGVTGYEKEDFKVYHRLYDVMNITVISDKDTVGYYDMNSSITVTEEKESYGQQ